MSKKNIVTPANSKPAKSITWSENNPVLAILIKFSIISLIIFSGIYYCETKGYFESDDKNNHIKKKWDAYYDYAGNKQIDILLIGSSHLYTGINPKNLSVNLGCTAFIIAAPGTNVDDHYFALEEAIKVNKPKLVVIETYGLSKSVPYLREDADLSNGLMSFAARKDASLKLLSTPMLFAVKNYPYAWSYTLRNHNYLYTNTEQIKKNISKQKKHEKSYSGFYLGRYIRFTSGIKDSVLNLYKTKGAPVDGNNYKTNDLMEDYIERITNLCKENNIEIIFLTLPMFDKHISNYAVWKDRLSNSLGTYSEKDYWLNLQDSVGYKGFSEDCFENTYEQNQHMTFKGSLLASYKLADFIRSQKRIRLTDRSNDKAWRDLFHDQEGFIENNMPIENDTTNIVLFSVPDKELKDTIVEVVVVKKKENFTLIAKYKPSACNDFISFKNKKIKIAFIAKNSSGAMQNFVAELPMDLYHSCNRQINFSQTFKPLDIKSVNGLMLID